MTIHSLNPQMLWQNSLKLDRVVLAVAAVFAAILLFAPQQFGGSLAFTGEGLLAIAPYLAASVLIAAYLKGAGADHLIARIFSGRPALMIVSASLFGALSPFCSCGVIPIIAALLAMGVPLGPVMAFWVSSPLMAPDMFLLTAGELGLGFAIGKTLAAIGIGLLAGFGTQAAQRAGLFSNPLREGVGDGGCGASSLLANKQVAWRFWSEPERVTAFRRNAVDTGWFLVRWLTLAFVLESLMVAYLPGETVAGWVGGESLWAIPLSVVVGVPAYLNGYAAIPLVGGLMNSGMAPGAAMAFMTAGAMTSIPAAIAVFALTRKSVFVWYIGLALAGSALSGYAYQFAVA